MTSFSGTLVRRPLLCCVAPSHLFSNLWKLYVLQAHPTSWSRLPLFQLLQPASLLLEFNADSAFALLLLRSYNIALFGSCMALLSLPVSPHCHLITEAFPDLHMYVVFPMYPLAVVLSKAIMSGRPKNNKWYVLKDFTAGRWAEELCRNYR